MENQKGLKEELSKPPRAHLEYAVPVNASPSPHGLENDLLKFLKKQAALL